MERYEVFVARMAPGLATASSFVNTSFLMAMVSNTASMMRSAWARSVNSSVGFSKPMRCSTCSVVSLPFEAVAS